MRKSVFRGETQEERELNMVERTNTSELMDVEKQAELRERIRQGRGKIKGGVWGDRVKRSDNPYAEGNTGVGGEELTGIPTRINRSEGPRTQGENSGSAEGRKPRSPSPSLTRSCENWNTNRNGEKIEISQPILDEEF